MNQYSHSLHKDQQNIRCMYRWLLFRESPLANSKKQTKLSQKINTTNQCLFKARRTNLIPVIGQNTFLAQPNRRYSGAIVTAVTCPCQRSPSPSAFPSIYPIIRPFGDS